MRAGRKLEINSAKLGKLIQDGLEQVGGVALIADRINEYRANLRLHRPAVARSTDSEALFDVIIEVTNAQRSHSAPPPMLSMIAPRCPSSSEARIRRPRSTSVVTRRQAHCAAIRADREGVGMELAHVAAPDR